MSQQDIIKKVNEAIEEDPNKDFIQSISLFGSFLHEENRSDSDVDLLFEMKRTMSLFQICTTRHHLERKLGRKVDFVEINSLIPQLKNTIISAALKIYERK